MSGILGPADVLDYADLRRAELRDTSPCPNCHAPDPARLGRFRGIDGCSECLDFPRCLLCRRWTGSGYLPEERNLALADGPIVPVCVYCYAKADLETVS